MTFTDNLSWEPHNPTTAPSLQQPRRRRRSSWELARVRRSETFRANTYKPHTCTQEHTSTYTSGRRTPAHHSTLSSTLSSTLYQFYLQTPPLSSFWGNACSKWSFRSGLSLRASIDLPSYRRLNTTNPLHSIITNAHSLVCEAPSCTWPKRRFFT